MDIDKEYALYLSYNRWLHHIPLSVDEYVLISEAICVDPASLEEDWEDGCYPQDGEVFDPRENDNKLEG